MTYGSGGYGLGHYGEDDAVDPDPGGGGTVVIYIFEPPTHEEPMRTLVEPLVHYRLTYAKSVVRVNGLFTQISMPSFAITDGLEQGVDWFRGGYVYTVTTATKLELESQGFDVRTVTITDDGSGGETPPPTDDPPGFGEGGYGEGTYGA